MSQLGITRRSGEYGRWSWTRKQRERSREEQKYEHHFELATQRRKCRNKNVFNSMNLGKCEELGNEQRKLKKKRKHIHAENNSTHTQKQSATVEFYYSLCDEGWADAEGTTKRVPQYAEASSVLGCCAHVRASALCVGTVHEMV